MQDDSLISLRDKVVAAFQAEFNAQPEVVITAPGRVNIIGEHTDYNEGFVLPAAINRQVVLAASKRRDRLVHVRALDFDDAVEFSLDDRQRQAVSRWSNYQRGVAWALESEGYSLPGMNMALTSDVPIGSGLSSSAAIELATCAAFQELGGLVLDGVRRALICQKAENEFVGMHCGIMDQYIISLGKENHALLIDCRDLGYQLVPLWACGRCATSRPPCLRNAREASRRMCASAAGTWSAKTSAHWMPCRRCSKAKWKRWEPC